MSQDPSAVAAALEAAQTELAERESALAEIIAGVKAQKKDPEANGTVGLFRKMVDDTKHTVEKLQASAQAAERANRTKTIVEPLLAAFGTVAVYNAQEFRVEFVDVASMRNKLAEAAANIGSKISALDALSAAIAALAISEETAADLKAVRFVAASPTTYTLDMARASSGGARAGGTRASSSNQIFTITKANEDHQNLVGMKVGKGQDFETWRDLLKHTNGELFAKLEQGRLGTNPAKPGKKSNYSAALVAERNFGVAYDSTTTPS